MANGDLIKLTWRHRENSYNTQRARRAIVRMMANQLGDMGYMRLKAKNLKEKHAVALIERWKAEGLSAGTLKNRMGVLRWVYEKVDKSWMLARRNADYGIDNRRYLTNMNKAQELTPESLERIKGEHVRLSVQMQREFGLRREEAMKIDAAWADRGSKLVLKGSWTKGGRPREIPVETGPQRDLLDRVKAFAAGGSLIPAESTYIEHLKRYVNQTAAAGLEKLHGLRHAYAQERYKALTGRAAPVAGGRKHGDLSEEEKRLDREARMQISGELGHGRPAIVAQYCGK
ncbi:MAG: integrase domain-containing protein [Candidatus Tectomicrobia bacterium]|nr:integrase domain-containing protein [Candidatus Tectomicrobia bacterium]